MCLAEGKSEEDALVPWHEFEADHLKPWSKEGKTTIENGQVLCRFHNRTKSNKMG
jgi:predicted restriction endonuclease